MLKALSLFDRRARWKLGGIFALMVLIGLMQVVGVGAIFPFVTLLTDPGRAHESSLLQGVYDLFEFESDRAFLVFMGGVALAALVTANAYTAFAQWVLIRYSWGIQHQISVRLLEHYMARPYVSFLGANSSDLAKNVLAESASLVSGVILPSLQIMSAGTTLLFMFGFLVWVNPVLAPMTAGTLGLGYAIVYVLVRRSLFRLGRRRLDANAMRYKIVGEAFGGIKEIQALGRERYFIDRYVRPSRRYVGAIVARRVLSQVPRYAIETLAFGSILIIVLYMLSTGSPVDDIIVIASVFSFAGFRMMPALHLLYASATSTSFNRPVTSLLIEHLHSESDRTAPDKALRVPDAPLAFERYLRLEGVSLTYQGAARPAVEDVGITIRKGTSVAFVGETGSGKTTLADIILGLLQPDAGSLVVDDVPIDRDNVRAWRLNVGYVPQHIFLADDTVVSNVALGVPANEIDREAVVRAVRTAKVEEFAAALPQGLDTVIGERGVRLSGGQRQRIGIARALYHDPSVLVLDEATSSLDSVTEDTVLTAIEALAASKTIVSIAHRLSTVRDSDVIYLMERGRVVAQGSYDELFATNARFRALAQGWLRQAR